jgi:hypothetical protein
MGLLAYGNSFPIARCAVSPGSRCARAIKTPASKGRNPKEDGTVWFPPCFCVRKQSRKGIIQLLLESAVTLAKQRGANNPPNSSSSLVMRRQFS